MHPAYRSRCIGAELRANPAKFPAAAGQRRLEMISDHDRNKRRLPNRYWTEIKVR